MRNLFIIIVILLAPPFCYSHTFYLHGVLTDSLSKEALPFGNVFVRNAKDSIISGVLTDEKGNFTLKKIPIQPGLYLQVRYFGYNEKKVEIPSSGRIAVEMGTIALSQDMFKLKEATVVGTTHYMVQKFDRQVYNMSDNRIASARSVLDLLRTLPGVVVDERGNIRYKGAPATIYVDDQPVSFMYSNIEMIPVSLVKKIELIDASMYNGASGQGGIINFKLKPATTDGLSGIASIDASTINLSRADQFKGFINLNYKIGKLTFFDNYSETDQRQYQNQTATGFLNYDTLYQTNSASHNTSTLRQFFDFAGVQIQPGEQTQWIIGGGLSGTYIQSHIWNTSYQTYASSNSPFDAYISAGSSLVKLHGMNLGSWYMHNFSENKKLRGGFNFEHYSSPGNDDGINYTYQYLNALPTDSISDLIQKRREIRDELNLYLIYINVINSHIQWNVGINSYTRFRQIDDDEVYDNGMPDWPLSRYTNGRPQTHTLFWKLGTSIKRWKLSGGLNLQYDKISADYIRYQITNADTVMHFDRTYLHLLPSVTISFMIDSLQNIKLTYTRSITSPNYSYFDLCNFINRSNPRNWSQGNPDLKAISLHNIYLGYTYSKEKFNFSTETFFSLTNNDLFYVNYPYSSTIWLTIPENIARNSSLGVDFDSWVMLNETIDFAVSSSLSHTYINASSLSSQLQALGLSDNNLKKKDFGFNVKFNTNVRLNPSLSGMLYVNYFSREITFEGYSYGYINSSASLTKRCFNDKLLLTVGVNNLFDNFLNHGSYMDYAGVTQTTLQGSSDFKRNYFISLQYKFKQGDRGTKDYKTN